MDYLNRMISEWMPPDSPRVAVDSHPRLSGIMDTINATRAHGKPTRLPSEFYDKKALQIIDNIAVEEWFAGYQESNEYRQVGIGGLVGDLVSRMMGSITQNGDDGMLEVGGDIGSLGEGRGGEKKIKFAMSGCHDTTLAAILSSFGAFKGEQWPPFTSHLALELFKKADDAQTLIPDSIDKPIHSGRDLKPKSVAQSKSLWTSLFGAATGATNSLPSTTSRNSSKSATENVKDVPNLDGYYVRVRYNDRPLTIPGCKAPGNHLDGDESFCTLVSNLHKLMIRVLTVLIRRLSNVLLTSSLRKVGRRLANQI